MCTGNKNAPVFTEALSVTQWTAELAVDDDNRARLLALLAVSDGEFHLVTFVEGAEALALNFRVMDENVSAIFGGDEAIALITVEPLDDATSTIVRHVLSPKELHFAPLNHTHHSFSFLHVALGVDEKLRTAYENGRNANSGFLGEYQWMLFQQSGLDTICL